MAGEAARAADIAIEAARKGVGLRVFFKTETIKLQEVFFDAGESAAGHAHTEDQAGYIVSGRFVFTLDGTPYPLGAGDAYLIPGGVVHGAECLQTGSYVLFSALTTGQQAVESESGHTHDHGHSHDHGAHKHG